MKIHCQPDLFVVFFVVGRTWSRDKKKKKERRGGEEWAKKSAR
jgi:uncharacterized membrane protein